MSHTSSPSSSTGGGNLPSVTIWSKALTVTPTKTAASSWSSPRRGWLPARLVGWRFMSGLPHRVVGKLVVPTRYSNESFGRSCFTPQLDAARHRPGHHVHHLG